MAVAATQKSWLDVEPDDFYPVSDGKPMAETEKHRDLMIYFITAMQRHFAEDPNVYVSGNNFL